MVDPKHPRHYEESFKRQIVQSCENGKPAREIKAEYDISHSTPHRWVQGIRNSGVCDQIKVFSGGWCRFVGLVIDSITTDHATRPSSRRRSMMLMPNSVLIRLSRYQTM